MRTRSFEVCCADCAEKTEQYIKLDKRFKTALYLLVFLGGIGFVISAFFGGDSPLRMIGLVLSVSAVVLIVLTLR